jgi:putative peptidoglycan binding protein
MNRAAFSTQRVYFAGNRAGFVLSSFPVSQWHGCCVSHQYDCRDLTYERKEQMKKTHSTVLSSLVLSGAVLVMAPQAWSQTSSGTGSSQPGSQKSDPSASGSSSQRGTSGSSGEMQTQRSGSQRMSKDKVKEVQAALKSKGMDPGPEDGVLGQKTQGALREFQKSNNLPATGRIDEKTADALGVDMASSAGGSSSSGMGSSKSEAGSGASSSGSSATGKSGASQSSSGARGGTSANPPSKPAGKD